NSRSLCLGMSRDSMTAVRGAHAHNGSSAGSKENGQNAPSHVHAEPNTNVVPPGDIGNDTSGSSAGDLTQTWIQFTKTFVLIFPIYVLGYFEFSFSWLLIGLVIFFWWRRNTGGKNTRMYRALAFFEQEERNVQQSLTSSDLPSWVNFPDVERVEWLNKTVRQMWPYICQFVEKLLRETIEPAVKGANSHLSTFCFSKIDMGDKPLRINGVKVYTENVDKRQIIMDLQISFVGNTEIDVDVKRYYCKAGIKSIQLHGVLRVVMEPLLGDMPLVGALSLFFLKKPLLEINWTGLTNILDIPGLNGFSDSLIQDIIYSYLVLPNRITIPLVGDIELAQLRFPMPKGVLRIHFLEAQDLEGKDKFLGGLIKGKSDPYGVLQIGNQLFQSKTVKESLHPKWNEVYEALVYEHSGQHLEIELFDEDPDKDDFLGRRLLTSPSPVCLSSDLRLSLLSNQVLRSVRADRSLANDGLSSALLVVYLDSAKNLPSGKKTSSEPSPYVYFTVGNKSFESKIRYKTNEPMWEEAFSFLVHNPRRQELEVEVKDDKHKCTLGNLTVPLSGLLEEEDMTFTQQFSLRNSGPSSTLKLKLALRVLCLEKQTSASDQLSSVQVRKASEVKPTVPSQRLSASESPLPPAYTTPTPPMEASTHSLHRREERKEEPYGGSPIRSTSIRSTSNLSTTISNSQKHLPHKDSMASLASDISLPFATQELQQRLRQLQNGSAPSPYPLGEIQLTVRHSSQRNKLIVVVHACRNLIAFTKDGSDPFVRVYLLPDKSRTGRRKTSTIKKTLNPVYDQTFEFSVSMVELHRRTLDIAVKNGGSILSKHRGLLGKVSVSSQKIVCSKWHPILNQEFTISKAQTKFTHPLGHTAA
uniref:Extended synaptotagmin 2 n=1 Tax=Oncorhynchus mykiss TaxID=8022 RepID=A0A8C7S5G9_ONCMY